MTLPVTLRPHLRSMSILWITAQIGSHLSEPEVMERAATWAGLAFAPGIPNTLPGNPIIQRIDTLGEIRTVRARLFDREIVYSAPRFMQFVKLREQVERDPAFRRHLCVVPASAIRAQLAEDYQASLLDEARQRLVRRWPRATGGLDLPKWARVVFVLGVIGLLLVACLAPVLAQPVSVPLLGAVLLLPAALRLWAALAPQRAAGRGAAARGQRTPGLFGPLAASR